MGSIVEGSDFCAESGLCMGNTYLKTKSLHKYKRVAGGQDGLELMSVIDLVLKKEILCYGMRPFRSSCTV